MLFGKKTPTLSRLLVVEDEPLVAFDTEHLLSDQGYEMWSPTVDRVADAVAVIGSGAAIDLVLVGREPRRWQRRRCRARGAGAGHPGAVRDRQLSR
ncbi:hypothetical protein AB5I41_05055 [Sphingomonas sp. MMS24-JH45]